MENWLTKLCARISLKNWRTNTTTTRELACQEVVELITDYLEGVLSPERCAQLEEHLAGCDGCRNYLEQMRLTIGMLRSLAQEPVFPETKEELLQVFRQWKKQ